VSALACQAHLELARVDALERLYGGRERAWMREGGLYKLLVYDCILFFSDNKDIIIFTKSEFEQTMG
jgi:hypothetical protein